MISGPSGSCKVIIQFLHEIIRLAKVHWDYYCESLPGAGGAGVGGPGSLQLGHLRRLFANLPQIFFSPLNAIFTWKGAETSASLVEGPNFSRKKKINLVKQKYVWPRAWHVKIVHKLERWDFFIFFNGLRSTGSHVTTAGIDQWRRNKTGSDFLMWNAHCSHCHLLRHSLKQALKHTK